MTFEQKEKYTGMHRSGLEVSFNKTWGGHEFTDDECQQLLNGETILLTDCVSKNGKPYGCYGKLAQQEYNGHKFWGFMRTEWFHSEHVPDTWCGHTFTNDEKEMLEAGQSVRLSDTFSAHTGHTFDCVVRWGHQFDGENQKHIIPDYDTV